MIARLINASRSYTPDGMVCVSATCQLRAVDGLAVIYEEPVSAQINLVRPTWKDDLKDGLLAQISQIKAQYTQAMAIVQGAYPTATTPDEALALFMAEVEAGANV